MLSVLAGCALAGFCAALTLRTKWGAISILFPIITYALYEDSSDTAYEHLILRAVLVANMGASLALAVRLIQSRVRWSPGKGLLVSFLVMYALSYCLSYSLGVSARSLLTVLTFIFLGLANALLAEQDQAHNAGTILILAGFASTALSYLTSDTWMGGSWGADWQPVSALSMLSDRRFGYVPQISFDACLLSAAVLAARTVQSSHHASTGNRRIVANAFLVIQCAAYVTLSQFRVMILASVSMLLIAVACRLRRIGGTVVFFPACLIVALGVLSHISQLTDVQFLSRSSVGRYDDRREISAVSMNIFRESPIIGHGILSNGPLFVSRSSLGVPGAEITGSHSTYATILTELGLLGIVTWAILLLRTMAVGFGVTSISSSRPPRSLDDNRTVFFALVGICIVQFFHGYVYPPILWFVLGWPYKADRSNGHALTVSSRVPS